MQFVKQATERKRLYSGRDDYCVFINITTVMITVFIRINDHVCRHKLQSSESGVASRVATEESTSPVSSFPRMEKTQERETWNQLRDL